MAVARVQGVGGSNTTNANLDLVLPGAPTAGNHLVCSAGSTTDGMTITSVTLDPAGVNAAFTAIYEDEGGAIAAPLTMWRLENIPAGAGTTVRIVASAGKHCNVMESSGVRTSAADDGNQHVVDQAAGTSGDTGAGITTTFADDMLVGILQGDGNISSISGSIGGVGADTPNPSSTSARSGLWYRVVAATGTYDATATWTGSVVWSMGVAAFMGIAVAPGAVDLPPGRAVVPNPGVGAW